MSAREKQSKNDMRVLTRGFEVQAIQRYWRPNLDEYVHLEAKYSHPDFNDDMCGPLDRLTASSSESECGDRENILGRSEPHHFVFLINLSGRLKMSHRAPCKDAVMAGVDKPISQAPATPQNIKNEEKILKSGKTLLKHILGG